MLLVLCSPFSASAGILAPASKPFAEPAKQAHIHKVAVFGRDDRANVPKKYASVRGRIGLLFNSRARTLCTAFCVAPNVIATAAHCLFRRTEWGPQPLSEFWFEVKRRGRTIQSQISGYADRAAMQNVIAGTTNLRVRPPIDAANDWALIRLARPVCYGHSLEVAPLAPTQLERAAREKRIFQISFHRDYRKWQLAYSKPCTLRREFKSLSWSTVRQEFINPQNLILHRCDTAGASSGSPIFVDEPDGPKVVGINVGTYVQSRVLRNSRASRTAKATTIANTGVNAAAFRQHISHHPQRHGSHQSDGPTPAPGSFKGIEFLWRTHRRHLWQYDPSGHQGLPAPQQNAGNRPPDTETFAHSRRNASHPGKETVPHSRRRPRFLSSRIPCDLPPQAKTPGRTLGPRAVSEDLSGLQKCRLGKPRYNR